MTTFPFPINFTGNSSTPFSAQVNTVINWLTFTIGLPAIGLAMYALKNLSKVALLSPSPLLLFFAVDSWRALVCSLSNPPTPERRRTVLGVGAIWANYTLLYVPFIFSILLEALKYQDAIQYLGLVSHMLLYLSLVVDPFIYIFMTKGVKEVLHAMPCCPNPSQKDKSPTVDTVAETVETRL
ncbi:hypothetical protein Q8A73_001078 [Channa argus]|nr:hypothetical protein Q8A73_001078 [Channa argus]